MSFIYQIRGLRKLVLIVQNVLFKLYWGKVFGENVRIFGFPLITIPDRSKMKSGKDIVMISVSEFNQIGVNHPVIIRLMNREARLTFGDRVGLNGATIVVEKEIRIGHDVLIGANACIFDTDFHPVEPEDRRSSKENIGVAPVVIDDNVFIGMNSIIMKGVTIGKNSIIGAGSVVTKNIPANQIWGGNPAKFIKEIA